MNRLTRNSLVGVILTAVVVIGGYVAYSSYQEASRKFVVSGIMAVKSDYVDKFHKAVEESFVKSEKGIADERFGYLPMDPGQMSNSGRFDEVPGIGVRPGFASVGFNTNYVRLVYRNEVESMLESILKLSTIIRKRNPDIEFDRIRFQIKEWPYDRRLVDVTDEFRSKIEDLIDQ